MNVYLTLGLIIAGFIFDATGAFTATMICFFAALASIATWKDHE